MYHNIMVYSFCSSELASTSANATKTDSSADVIGRTFNTPLRASAVANLAQKDKSAQKSAAVNLAQKLAAESVETSSRASSVPRDAHDVARGYVRELYRVLISEPLCVKLFAVAAKDNLHVGKVLHSLIRSLRHYIFVRKVYLSINLCCFRYYS